MYSPGYPPILFPRDDAAAYIGVSVRKLDAVQAQRRLTPEAIDGKRGYLRDDREEFPRSLPDRQRR